MKINVEFTETQFKDLLDFFNMLYSGNFLLLTDYEKKNYFNKMKNIINHLIKEYEKNIS